MATCVVLEAAALAVAIISLASASASALVSALAFAAFLAFIALPAPPPFAPVFILTAPVSVSAPASTKLALGFPRFDYVNDVDLKYLREER